MSNKSAGAAVKKVVALRPGAARRASPEEAKGAALGPGLHPATVEARKDGVEIAFRVRLLDGRRLSVPVSEHVERELVEECMRLGRPVVLCEGERGPAIMGALQTSRAVALDVDGALDVTAKDIKLRAEGTLSIESGPVTLRVDQRGVLRLEGDRMVIDMGSLVRLLSARVELP
jgi:hypothetical protein